MPRNHSGANICPSTIPVPICARLPSFCPYVTAHPSGAHTFSGSIPVPISVRVPFRCLYVPGHFSGAHMRCPYVHGHLCGSHMCPFTIPVPICAWAHCRCPCMLTHPFVPICDLAPFWYPYVARHPGTLPVPNCAQVPYCFQDVHGHLCSAHMWPGTVPVPICARAPLRCQIFARAKIPVPIFA